MEMLQLKYFKAVAEMGKISAAAESLFISPPALSAAISRLEKDLGMPLFDRANNKITLNRQGEIFLLGVNRIFATLENTREEMNRSLVQGNQRKLTLCMISSTQWVELVTSYAQRYPEVTLSCVDMSRSHLEMVGLPAGQDFLLAVETDVPAPLLDELEKRVLMEDHPVIMVNPRHPLAEKGAVELEELKGENLFLPMHSYPLSRYLKQMFHRAQLPFPSENTLSHLTARQMAAKGLGIGFSTIHTVRTDGPELCYIPIRTPHEPWNLCLFWRKGDCWRPEARDFVSFVEEYCQEGGLHNINIMQDETF